MCPTACSPCFTFCYKLHLDKTQTLEYDVGGNITSRKEYALTTSSTLFNPTKTDTYSYSNDWKDQLTSYNGYECVYDSAKLIGTGQYNDQEVLSCVLVRMQITTRCIY